MRAFSSVGKVTGYAIFRPFTVIEGEEVVKKE
jgi:hypothetical protein